MSLHLVASRNVSTWPNFCSNDTRVQPPCATLAAAADARTSREVPALCNGRTAFANRKLRKTYSP
jgi:hypothetical protein